MRKKLTTTHMRLWVGMLMGFFLFSATLVQAQVSGKVTDQATGDPLVGASVVVKGKSVGTLTGNDGTFSVEASEGDVLIVSFISYVAQEITVGSSSEINVQLRQGLLDEVLITGYSSQSRANVSGAVSSVQVDELRSLPASSVESNLQGRVAGVTVSTTGVPGSGTLVRIRGFGTINNNQPLYIVDGLPVQGGILELNPNDIKEMTVLKDASAASIYGSRASNGVIIITTKTGSVTGKPTLTFDASVGSQWNNNFPEMVDPLTFANLEAWEKPTNLGQPTGSPFYGTGSSAVLPNYLWPIGANTVDESEYFYSTNLDRWNGITRANHEGTDWFDEIYNPGMVQNYNVSVTGGTGSSQYAIGLGHFDQEGSRIYAGYSRTNLRSNSLFRINDRLTIGQNATIAYVQEKGNRGASGSGSIIGNAFRQPGIIPVYDISDVNFSSNKGLGSASNNPVQVAWAARENLNTKIRALATAFLEWEIIDNLTAKTSFSTDFANSDFRGYSRAVPNDSEPRLGNSLTRSTNQVLNWTWYNTLTYSNTFGANDITVLAGTEAIKNSFKGFGAQRINFLLENSDFMVINAGPTDGQSTNGGRSESSLFSVFGKVDYAFDGKYLLSATIRRDGSSRFGANNRFAIFPAFSAGWRISDEDFFNSGFINELKIRGGWGKTGNQNIDNLAQFTLFSTAEITTATYDIAGTNNSSIAGIQGTNIGNPNLKWEETTDVNVGIDAAFLDNSVTFVLDLYNRNTTDLLLPVPPSTLIGVVGNQFRNVAEMNNRGFDLSLGWNNYNKGSDLTIETSAVVSAYQNEIVALDSAIDFIAAGGFRSSNYTRTAPGYPISSYFGLQIDGIFQDQAEVDAHADQAEKAVGRFKFADINEDGVVDDDDRTFLGSPHPDFTVGWNTTVGFKGLDFNMFWQAVYGNEILDLNRLFTDLQQFQGNRHVRTLQSFGREGLEGGVPNSEAILPIYGTITSAENGPNSYYVQDGSFLRLKNVSLGYTLGRDLVGAIGMQSLRLYVQANNIITFTGYTGQDPEVNFVGNNDLSLGMDGGFWPVPKSIQGGATIKF